MTKYIKPISPPLFILAALNLTAIFYPLPVFFQLMLNACLTLHVGCILSAGMGKASYKEIDQCQQNLRSGSRSVTGWKRIWQIVQYPVLGCVVLLGLYFLIKNTKQSTLSTLLDLLFICSTTVYGSSKLNVFIMDAINGLSKKYNLGPKLQKILQFSSKYVLCPVFVASISLLYIIQRHWLLNNLFALFFAITTLKETGLRSFTIVVPALWLLFLYDMYWVYRSDVMVTVAKGIDLPLKLIFPYKNDNNEIGYSILGLGDIIIPGLFASLCLKYDIDNYILGPKKPTKFQHFTLPLYYTALALYTLGLVLTYSAMFVFSHPQPALVFIVPCLTLALPINRCFGSRLPLQEYNSDAMTKNNQTNQII